MDTHKESQIIVQDGRTQNSKPKVLVVIRWPVGGIRTWCRYVYRNAAFARYDVEVLMPQDPESFALVDDLAETGVRTKVLDTDNSTRSFVIAVAKHIFGQRFALVHSHGFTSGLASVIPCKLRRVPHVVTPHDMLLETQHRDFRGRVARSLIDLMLRQVDCVQPVSEAAAENLARAFPKAISNSHRVQVVRNGVDAPRFLSALPEEVRDRYDIPHEAILVGFFGRFMAPKGFRYLIEAVALHRKAGGSGGPMVVLAVGSGGFRREEVAVIKSLGVEDCFRFIDFVPDIAGLIKSVDVVAMPSIWEACGLVAMETLVAGTPLVVSDCSALLEVAKDSPAKIVAAKDAEALLDGIRQMSTSEHKVTAKSYMNIAAGRFDVCRTVDGIESLYARLTAK